MRILINLLNRVRFLRIKMIKKTPLLFIILLSVFCLFTGEFAYSSTDITENSWANIAILPTARDCLGVVAVNEKLYAIGGYGNGYGESIDTNEEFDPKSSTWETKESMSIPRANFGIATIENKIYVIGGTSHIGYNFETKESMICCLNEVYDPLTDTWETKKSMPTNRSELNANVVDGKIYLVGGKTSWQSLPVALNEVYDPVADSWTTKASMPYPVARYTSAVIDEKIYILGGQNGSTNLAFNQIYDPKSDTWSLGASLPILVNQAATEATTGTLAPKRIYVLGGQSNSNANAGLTQVYDPKTDSWTSGASMPTVRWNFDVAVLNDTLYVMGGVSDFMLFNTQSLQYIPLGYGRIQASQYPSSTPSPTHSISLDKGIVSIDIILVTVAGVITVVGAATIVFIVKKRSK